jgi:hypothetical protein
VGVGDDAVLLEQLMQLLTARTLRDPYSDDGRFAANVASLPPGLRVMAATLAVCVS